MPSSVDRGHDGVREHALARIRACGRDPTPEDA
jgi:hypothetical protein